MGKNEGNDIESVKIENASIKIFRFIDQTKWTLLDFVSSGERGIFAVVYNTHGVIKAFPISELQIVK